MKELTTLVLILAIPFGARAVMEVAWYRFRSRATAKTRIGWGPDSLGLPRPIFFSIAAGLASAAVALLVVVGVQFGPDELLGVVFIALAALLLIAALTMFAVIYLKWLSRRWGYSGRNRGE